MKGKYQRFKGQCDGDYECTIEEKKILVVTLGNKE